MYLLNYIIPQNLWILNIFNRKHPKCLNVNNNNNNIFKNVMSQHPSDPLHKHNMQTQISKDNKEGA